jgi:hypothetical protein
MQDLLILANTSEGQNLFSYKLHRMELKAAHSLAVGLLEDISNLNLVQDRPPSNIHHFLNKSCQEAGINPLPEQPTSLTAVWCDGPMQGVVWQLDMKATRIIDGKLVLFRT